jgi:hypothetical protein
LLRRVVELAYPLSLCQFGNYIVSHVLAKGSPVLQSSICLLVSTYILDLAIDKYASNVV